MTFRPVVDQLGLMPRHLIMIEQLIMWKSMDDHKYSTSHRSDSLSAKYVTCGAFTALTLTFLSSDSIEIDGFQNDMTSRQQFQCNDWV